MSKRRLIPSIILALCLACVSVFGIAFSKTNTASAETLPSVNFKNKITKQGDNNLYYCWGTVDNYVLMEYAPWDNSFKWIEPYEQYTYVETSGDYCVWAAGVVWSSMVVWVADRSGTVTFDGTFHRIINAGNEESGDGVGLEIVHRDASDKEVLLDQLITKNSEAPVSFNRSITISKGDRIIVAANSGPSHHQKNDTLYGKVTITYTSASNDYVANEDLSSYLDITHAGAVAGYKDMSGAFMADTLAAKEIIVSGDKTDVIIRGQSAVLAENAVSADKLSAASVWSLLPVIIVAACGVAATVSMFNSVKEGDRFKKSKMSKIVIIALVLVLLVSCFSFAGFGKISAGDVASANDQTINLAASDSGVDNWNLYKNVTFNNTKDAANVQGYNNWYYICGKPGAGNYSYMGFNKGSGKWCSAYNQLYYFTYIWGDWLPDGQTSQGVGMAFNAPATGTIKIVVKLKLKCDTEAGLSSNGVRFQASNSTGKDSYIGAVIDSSSSSYFNKVLTYTKEDVSVAKGEDVLFLLYAAGSGNDCCYTSVDITVQYTGA